MEEKIIKAIDKTPSPLSIRSREEYLIWRTALVKNIIIELGAFQAKER